MAKKCNEYYLEKIIGEIHYIVKLIQGISFEEFTSNVLIKDSTCFRFIQISEYGKILERELIDKNKQIPFNKIIGLRNRIVHDYGGVDLTVIYKTATNDLLPLRSQLEELLTKLK